MKLKPSTSVTQLAISPLLDQLSGPALVVYVRLVAASGKHGKRMVIPNRKLHRDTRTAQRVLQQLKARKLVRVTFASTDDGNIRTLELV